MVAATLKSRVAVVTGASRGLGKTIAIDLLYSDWNVAVCSTTIPVISHKNISIGRLDVRYPHQVTAFIGKVLDRYGRIDVLINNAGYAHRLNHVENITNPDAVRTVETNLLGPFYFIKAVLPIMKKQNRGYILNISSRCGETPHSKMGVYGASKAGLKMLTDSVNADLYYLKSKVRCVSFTPPAMDTRMREKVVGDAEQQVSPNFISSLVINMIESYEWRH